MLYGKNITYSKNNGRLHGSHPFKRMVYGAIFLSLGEMESQTVSAAWSQMTNEERQQPKLTYEGRMGVCSKTFTIWYHKRGVFLLTTICRKNCAQLNTPVTFLSGAMRYSRCVSWQDEQVCSFTLMLRCWSGRSDEDKMLANNGDSNLALSPSLQQRRVH